MPHPTSSHPLGCHRVRAELPVLHSSFPTATCFTDDDVYVSVLLSGFVPVSPSPVLFTSLFSAAVPLFSSHKQVHQYHFSRFHMYVLIHKICFSLYDLLHSASQALSSATSLECIKYSSPLMFLF